MEKDDVREKDENKFYGIAPGKHVRLRYGPIIYIESVASDLVKARVLSDEETSKTKVKGILHWINDSNSV